MKLVALLMGVAVFCQGLYGRDKATKETITSGGKKRVYYVFVPSSLPTANVPLLVTLHGSGRDGSSLVDKWKDVAAKEGLIVAGPDADNPVGWAAPVDGPELLRDLVESLKQRYPINPRRVYLFGHSAGAVFALAMSTWEAQYFAATAVHAGAFKEAWQMSVVQSAKRKIPIAMFSGTADPFFPIKDARATRDAFQAAGIPFSLTEMKGHDHDYYGVSGKLNPEIWDFFRDKELPEDPRYVEQTFVR